ncbi:Uncharacterised protein [Mycobacterium tuberculosis]|nr:Uncharacterised protein [Mycobacterium tuberculosis]COX69442.1 Uncharacterised protein [Mycobacterium tuberculosis]
MVQPDDRNVPAQTDRIAERVDVVQYNRKRLGSSQHAGIDPTECCPVVQGPPCWYCHVPNAGAAGTTGDAREHHGGNGNGRSTGKACEGGLGGVGSVH